MKTKKSQMITLFIITGILILAAFAFYYLAFDNKFEVWRPSISDRNIFDTSVQACIEQMAAEWLLVHGMHTGNYELDSGTFGLNKSALSMPDKETAQVQLTEFLNKNYHICMPAKKFSKGYNISKKEPEFNVEIAPENVYLSYSSLFYAQKDKTAFSFGEDSIIIRMRAGEVMQLAGEHVKERKDKKYIKIDNQLKAAKRDIDVGRNSTLEHWLITDNSGREPYYFAFLVRLDV